MGAIMAIRPQSTVSICPVTALARSLARKSAAGGLFRSGDLDGFAASLEDLPLHGIAGRRDDAARSGDHGGAQS